MFQTQFVYFIGNFGAKTAGFLGGFGGFFGSCFFGVFFCFLFFTKTSENITSKYYYFESPVTSVCTKGYFGGYNILKAYEKCYKISHVCTLALREV
jgi:hypothetical protein